MRASVGALAALAVLFVLGPAATGASGPPQGTQTNGAFAASYAAGNVASTSVTTQKTSCYRPQVFYDGALPPEAGNHKYNNGSNQTNATVPPEAVAVSVRPHGATTASDWKTKLPNGQPDYVMTAKNANTSDPDKQWIVIDTNPTSRCYGTVYAMYTVFVLNPSVVFVSTAKAQANGTHTAWTTPQELPTVDRKSTRLNSSHTVISYAVFCLKKKKTDK